MYRAGVVGCRNIGVHHGLGFGGLDNTRLVAGCDLSEDRLSEFRDRCKEVSTDIACYTDHRELLQQEQLDILTVATSDHLHADIVVNAAEAGVKGIFCEKPLATNLADADCMIAACEHNGTLLSVDHVRRFEPIWLHAKSLIDQGVIGPVQYVIGTLSGERSMLFRNGTHTIDAMCWLAGADPTFVVGDLETGYEDYSQYRGDGGHVPASEPGAYGFMGFANGVRGFYIGGSKTTPLPKQRLEVVGTTGRLVSGSDERITILHGDEEEVIEMPLGEHSAITRGVHELVNALAAGEPSISPGRAGLTVVEVIIGILESQQRGHAPVPIPVPRQDLT